MDFFWVPNLILCLDCNSIQNICTISKINVTRKTPDLFVTTNLLGGGWNPLQSPSVVMPLITRYTNLQIVNLLNTEMNLDRGTYQTYRKPDNRSVYINRKSNHPPTIIKQISRGTGKWTSAISSCEVSKTLKYWVGVQPGQSYLMGRKCLFSLGWQSFW